MALMRKSIVFTVCLMAAIVGICWGEQKNNAAPLEKVKEENKMSMERPTSSLKRRKSITLRPWMAIRRTCVHSAQSTSSKVAYISRPDAARTSPNSFSPMGRLR